MPKPEGMGQPAPQRQHNEDRMRRARAWLLRSEREGTQDIERFVFLWIAFNSAYGNEAALRDFVEGLDGREGERERFRAFLRNIVDKDGSGVLEEIVWEKFSGPIRLLLANHYVFQPFWKAVWRSELDGRWRQHFERSRAEANAALKRQDTFKVLSFVFDRLYTLRNQIFHGGMTYPSGFGRTQIRDGSRIMKDLVPAILGIMQRDIDADPDSESWGHVAYPRINAEAE